MRGEMTGPSLDGPRSAYELLKVYDLLSIPHFQRGLVWDTSAVALLLESLYYGTPCGSIILWAPGDVSAQGTRLGKSARYLIVDGQQRIRSLHDVFRDTDDDSVTSPGNGGDGDDETDPGLSEQGGDDEKGVWCLNLGRLPEFEDGFPGGKRFRLFRRATDPRDQYARRRHNTIHGAPLRDREALVPLKWFLDQDEGAIHQLVGKEGRNRAIATAAEAVLQNRPVNERVRQMLERPVFQVVVLDSQRSLVDVIGIYNRINSAGKRVEAEEKAFANLVAESERDANRSLKKFFSAVGGNGAQARRNHHRRNSRDDLLRRQKESRFGFKLFMRAFVIVLAYHSDRTIGSASLSFESANPETLAGARAILRRILETTVNLLDDVAKILRRALHCDDFRMLPETASLWPLFQLLIRFPGLMPKAEDALSSIALRLILADMKKSELLNLSTQVNSVQRTKAAMALFDDHKRLTSPAIQRAIQDGIKRAQSLTGRYALVLYWLLRRQGARDFLYNANVPDKAEELRSKYGSEELELCERVEPEKQHIVPYDRLKDVFNLQGRARPGRHAVHDIGNLTYISASLNSFETGVGSRPLRLSDEPQKNLYAHMLMDSGLLSLYEDACRYADTRDPRFDRRMARARYGKFCSRRREAIKERLIKWERELRNASRLHDAEDLDLLPAERLINPQIDDKIRRLNYPPSVTESVIKLCDRKRMGKSRKTGVDLSIAYQKKSTSGGVQQVLRVDLHEGGRALELKLADDTFRAKFRRRYPEIQLGTGKKSLCRLKTESEEAAQVAEMVDWIASQLPQSGEDDA